MQKAIKLTKYHIIVIGIYVVLLPIAIFLFPHNVNYNFLAHDTVALEIFAVTLLFFCAGIFLLKKSVWNQIKFTDFSLVLIYGILFAIPEEILFRGIIQNFFQGQTNAILAVIIASFVFGMAHLLNGAKGYYPSGWNWKFSSLAFLAGLPLGMLFLMTDSLLLPTLLHVFFILGLQLSDENIS